MIVEIKRTGGCICHFDDSAYAGKSEKDYEKITDDASALIKEFLRKKREKTA